MRRLVVAMVFALTVAMATSSALAYEIRAYDVRLYASNDGSARGSASLQFDRLAPGRIAIPLGFAAVRGLRLISAVPPGTSVASNAVNGQTIVLVDLQRGAPALTTIAFAFEVPQAFVVASGSEKSTLPDRSMLRHALVNSQPAPIGAYRAEVIFPDGMRAHAIREALPKLGKKEATPRVRLATIDSRNGARLQVARLLQGESASMQLELVPQKKSLGWLMAGLVLSILYLVSFRDLVAKKVA